MQVTADNVAEVAAWITASGQHALVVGVAAKVGLAGEYIDIETREGMRRAVIGDWVARDSAGEFYPVPGPVFPRRLQEPADPPEEPEEPGDGEGA